MQWFSLEKSHTIDLGSDYGLLPNLLTYTVLLLTPLIIHLQFDPKRHVQMEFISSKCKTFDHITPTRNDVFKSQNLSKTYTHSYSLLDTQNNKHIFKDNVELKQCLMIP